MLSALQSFLNTDSDSTQSIEDLDNRFIVPVIIIEQMDYRPDRGFGPEIVLRLLTAYTQDNLQYPGISYDWNKNPKRLATGQTVPYSAKWETDLEDAVELSVLRQNTVQKMKGDSVRFYFNGKGSDELISQIGSNNANTLRHEIRNVIKDVPEKNEITFVADYFAEEYPEYYVYDSK